MGLKSALKKAGGSIKKAVTAPVKATKQLAKGDVKGSLKTARGGARAAMAPVKNAVMAPIRANKQLLKGNVRGALQTAGAGLAGFDPRMAPAPRAAAPVGQGGIAQDIFAGAPNQGQYVAPGADYAARGGVAPQGPAPARAPLAGAIMGGGGFTGMGGGAAMPALATAAPAIGNMAGMLSGQFGAPAKKPVQPGGFDMGGFDMGGGY